MQVQSLLTQRTLPTSLRLVVQLQRRMNSKYVLHAHAHSLYFHIRLFFRECFHFHCIGALGDPQGARKLRQAPRRKRWCPWWKEEISNGKKRPRQLLSQQSTSPTHRTQPPASLHLHAIAVSHIFSQCFRTSTVSREKAARDALPLEAAVVKALPSVQSDDMTAYSTLASWLTNFDTKCAPRRPCGRVTQCQHRVRDVIAT